MFKGKACSVPLNILSSVYFKGSKPSLTKPTEASMCYKILVLKSIKANGFLVKCLLRGSTSLRNSQSLARLKKELFIFSLVQKLVFFSVELIIAVQFQTIHINKT